MDCSVQITTNMTKKEKKWPNSALSKNSPADIFRFGDLEVIPSAVFPWDALGVWSIPNFVWKSIPILWSISEL